MSEEGVRSPNEKDITQLFMAHYAIAAYNGCEIAYDTAKVYKRWDKDRDRTVLLGKFHIPEESGLPDSSVTFMTISYMTGAVHILVSVLNTESGNFENYSNLRGQPHDVDLYTHVARFVARVACGGADEEL